MFLFGFGQSHVAARVAMPWCIGKENGNPPTLRLSLIRAKTSAKKTSVKSSAC